VKNQSSIAGWVFGKQIMQHKRMKTTEFNKKPGTDNINAELLQAAGPQMTQRIEDLILNIWISERMLTNGTSQ
jgi:hypothetical protein